MSVLRCIHDDSKLFCFLYLLWYNQSEYYHNHNMYCTAWNTRSWMNLQATCTQRRWYAVFTMIWSRPISCTYCDIINLSITTITLCIAQKMQEAERIFNHHVYNVGAIRCIYDDSKSSCFLYLLSHNEFEYYHNHSMYCTENARSWKNLQSTCTQRRWYAVFTMMWSRPVSCTYCHIINLSITTLCIAQKMQEAVSSEYRVYTSGKLNCSCLKTI